MPSIGHQLAFYRLLATRHDTSATQAVGAAISHYFTYQLFPAATVSFREMLQTPMPKILLLPSRLSGTHIFLYRLVDTLHALMLENDARVIVSFHLLY